MSECHNINCGKLLFSGCIDGLEPETCPAHNPEPRGQVLNSPPFSARSNRFYPEPCGACRKCSLLDALKADFDHGMIIFCSY